MEDLLDGIQLGELRGRRQRKLTALVVRPLQEADIAVLNAGGRQVTQHSPIKRLRDRHHLIARLVALGKGNAEISLVSGMDAARISYLKSDPAFKELVSDYSKIEAGLQAEITDRMAMLSLTAVEEMQDRIENSEEPLPLQSLLDIAKFGTDRTGYGPVTKQMNTNVNVDLSARLASARKRLDTPGNHPQIAETPSILDADFEEVK